MDLFASTVHRWSSVLISTLSLSTVRVVFVQRSLWWLSCVALREEWHSWSETVPLTFFNVSNLGFFFSLTLFGIFSTGLVDFHPATLICGRLSKLVLFWRKTVENSYHVDDVTLKQLFSLLRDKQSYMYVPQTTKLKLYKELKRDIYKSTVIDGDFNISLTINTTLSRNLARL